MPQIGVHCSLGDVPHQQCRECALNPLHPCMLTPDMLEKLRRPDQKDEPVFSPTRILSCQRREVLQKETDYYTDIKYNYPLTRGNMLHALMEDSRYPGALYSFREQQFWTTVETRFGPQRFEGKVDLVVIKDIIGGKPNQVKAKVVDYKTTTEVDHDMTAALPNHVAQINMYRWLVSRELPKLLGWDDLVEVDVDEVELEYAGMNKPRRFSSAGPLQTEGKMLTRKPPTYAVLDLAPIPLWSLASIERAVIKHIEERLELKDKLPDVLPEEERWQCERCPVNAECWKRWNA